MSDLRDGNGAPIDPEAYYYCQDRRSYVGNCALWWAHSRIGYTCELLDAHVFSGKQILSEGWRETDVFWPVRYVRERVRIHVRAEQLAITEPERKEESDG